MGSCKQQPKYKSFDWLKSKDLDTYFANGRLKNELEGKLRYNDQLALLDAKFDKVSLEDVESYTKDKKVELYYHDFFFIENNNKIIVLHAEAANIKNVGFFIEISNIEKPKYSFYDKKYEFTNFNGTDQFICTSKEEYHHSHPNNQFYKLKDDKDCVLTKRDKRVMNKSGGLGIRAFISSGGKRRKTRRRNRKSKKTRKSRNNRRKSKRKSLR